METGLSLVVGINDLLQRHVGPGQEANEAEGGNGEVFEEQERRRRLTGKRHQLHQRREDERQRRAANSTDQWDHQI